MAIWDISGKLAGQLIRCLLGNYRNSFETDLTVYLDDPQIMTEKAQSVVDRRFKTVKVKLGESTAADITRMRAVREKVGNDVKLRIGANQ